MKYELYTDYEYFGDEIIPQLKNVEDNYGVKLYYSESTLGELRSTVQTAFNSTTMGEFYDFILEKLDELFIDFNPDVDNSIHIADTDDPSVHDAVENLYSLFSMYNQIKDDDEMIMPVVINYFPNDGVVVHPGNTRIAMGLFDRFKNRPVDIIHVDHDNRVQDKSLLDHTVFKHGARIRLREFLEYDSIEFFAPNHIHEHVYYQPKKSYSYKYESGKVYMNDIHIMTLDNINQSVCICMTSIQTLCDLSIVNYNRYEELQNALK